MTILIKSLSRIIEGVYYKVDAPSAIGLNSGTDPTKLEVRVFNLSRFYFVEQSLHYV